MQPLCARWKELIFFLKKIKIQEGEKSQLLTMVTNPLTCPVPVAICCVNYGANVLPVEINRSDFWARASQRPQNTPCVELYVQYKRLLAKLIF